MDIQEKFFGFEYEKYYMFLVISCFYRTFGHIFTEKEIIHIISVGKFSIMFACYILLAITFNHIPLGRMIPKYTDLGIGHRS